MQRTETFIGSLTDALVERQYAICSYSYYFAHVGLHDISNIDEVSLCVHRST